MWKIEAHIMGNVISSIISIFYSLYSQLYFDSCFLTQLFFYCFESNSFCGFIYFLFIIVIVIYYLLLLFIIVIYYCYFFIYYYYYFLAAPHDVWDLSSLTRRGTCACCIGSTVSIAGLPEMSQY